MWKKKIVGADVVHREYIAKLYEKLNKKLEKRYRKGNIFEEMTVEDIEIFARITEEDYKAIGNVVVAKVEELLSAKLPYQDRAAIIIRQAEYVLDRPMFRKERGYVLSKEFEKDYGKYTSPEASGYFVGEWAPHRALIRDDDGKLVESLKRRASVPILVGFSKYDFLESPSWIVPGIWTISYSMFKTPPGAAFDSDSPGPGTAWCEFPTGVTMEEMEKVFEEIEEQTRNYEEGVKHLLGE